VSTNHNEVSGARYAAQQFGDCTKVTDADFDDGVADEIDPSEDEDYYYYRIQFRCDSGKTGTDITLTLYQEETEVGNGIDTVQVELGDRRCGLTGINSGDTITPNTTRAQHDITFTGTSDCKGVVEVILKIRDAAGGAGSTLRIGDISASGALD